VASAQQAHDGGNETHDGCPGLRWQLCWASWCRPTARTWITLSGSRDALQQVRSHALARRIENPFLPQVDSGFWAITAKHW
jgi:hypothetical protein